MRKFLVNVKFFENGEEFAKSMIDIFAKDENEAEEKLKSLFNETTIANGVFISQFVDLSPCQIEEAKELIDSVYDKLEQNRGTV